MDLPVYYIDILHIGCTEARRLAPLIVLQC